MAARTEKPAKGTAPICGVCRHGWRLPGLAQIECHRYPATLHKNASDVCGEFARKEKDDA